MDDLCLPLREALTKWTSPALVMKLKTLERNYTLADLTYFTSMTNRHRLSDVEDLLKHGQDRWIIETPDFGVLIGAHDDLVRDFRDRWVREDFYLRGVQAKPALTTKHRHIPGVWSGECKFDFQNNSLTIGELKFVAVAASRTAIEDALDIGSAAAAPAISQPVPEIHSPPLVTAESVRSLTDEEVLTLLEDHARRVIERDAARLIAPGKISLMPIILRKMKQRYEQNETRETLAAEAAYLAEWIFSKVPSHQVPTAGSIKNAMRNNYRAPKA